MQSNYQTRNKRRDFVERSKTMFGKLGAAGPAISLITGEVTMPKPAKKTPKSNYKPRRKKRG